MGRGGYCQLLLTRVRVSTGITTSTRSGVATVKEATVPHLPSQTALLYYLLVYHSALLIYLVPLRCKYCSL